MRSYWSFGTNGGTTAGYDRFGFGGPTHTPYPTIHAFLTNPTRRPDQQYRLVTAELRA